jgi:hypothetical protein
MHCHGYSFPIQAHIFVCCFLILYFLRVNQGCEDEYDFDDEEDGERFYHNSFDVDNSDDNAPATWRDGIAIETRMWLKHKRGWYTSLWPYLQVQF